MSAQSRMKTGTLARCRCGAHIARELYLRAGLDYRCEGCFLEAPAAALDERERETGLHSKRVVCHTTVLAKRFSSDRQQLRRCAE